MVAITVKNIPETLYQLLKKAAKLHRRSINSELIICLQNVLMPGEVSPNEHIEAARMLRARIKAEQISTEDITGAKKAGRA